MNCIQREFSFVYAFIFMVKYSMGKIKTDNIRFILYFVASLWVVHIVDWLLPYNLKSLGILPRNLKGLIGIFTAPFLHANLYHLISNTVPLLVLGVLLVIFYDRVALSVITFVIIVGGSLVWLLGRSAIHIGASGVIYGIAAFLIAYGIMRRKLVPVILSIVVAFIYGGSMLTGLLPGRGIVSWESHLFSAIAGVLAAFSLQDRRKTSKIR